MTVTTLCGFETALIEAEPGALSLTGTAAYSIAQARTGSRSLRCNPSSGATGYLTVGPGTTGWWHVGLYIASLPSVARTIISGALQAVQLNSDGRLEFYDSATSRGTTDALTTGQWYLIGVRAVTGTSVPLVQVDGITKITGTLTTGALRYLGCISTEASAIDIYFDDLIIDDTDFLPPSKVALLVPISDIARDALWVRGGNSTTNNLYIPISTIPPPGVASASETDNTNIQHNGNSSTGSEFYRADLTTYADVGISANDTVRAVQYFIRHGEDVNTGTKTISFSGAGNPADSGSGNFAAGDDGGAHGAETGLWVTRRNAIVTDPTVVVGTSPNIAVLRPGTEARVACIDFMGAYVAWTPAVAAVPRGRPSIYPPLLAQ